MVKTRNVMRDPGDGTVFECPNLTVLHYAGEDRWAFQEDVYDPQVFITMIAEWGRHAHGLGSLTDDEVAWFAANNPTALEA